MVGHARLRLKGLFLRMTHFLLCYFLTFLMIMNRIHFVQPGILDFSNASDLATVRTIIQKWVDGSIKGRIHPALRYTRPISKLAAQSKKKVFTVNASDIEYASHALRTRFRRTVRMRIRTPHRVVVYIPSTYNVGRFVQNLSEIMENRFLSVKLFSSQHFLLFQRVVLTVSPSIVEFDLSQYNIPALSSQILRTSLSGGEYTARSYIVVMNERSGVVSITERNIRQKPEDIDSQWMASC